MVLQSFYLILCDILEAVASSQTSTKSQVSTMVENKSKSTMTEEGKHWVCWLFYENQ